MDHGLCQQGSGGGAVAGDIVGLGGNFLHQLRAHVLKGIGQLNFLGDADAVVGDEGSAVLLIQNHVAALGAKGDLNGIGQLIDAGLQSLAGFIAAHNELRHNSYLRIFLKVGDCVPPLDSPSPVCELAAPSRTAGVKEFLPRTCRGKNQFKHFVRTHAPPFLRPLPAQTSEAFVPEKRGAAERANFGRKAEARDVQLVTSYSTMARISF